MDHAKALANQGRRCFKVCARGFKHGERAADFAIDQGGGIIAFGRGKMDHGVGRKLAH